MPGAPTDRRRYLHEAVLYDSDEEFLGVVVPFLQEGAAVGEPCPVALGSSATGLVRAAVANTTGLSLLDDRYDRPVSVMRSKRELFTAHLTDGASQIRVAIEAPHPDVGGPWDGCARYEAAINRAYAEFPLWGLCADDTRITPGPVLDDVARTHPHLAAVNGCWVNPRYQDPAEFLPRRPPSQADPVETASAPVIGLLDPTPAAARDAVHTNMTWPDSVRPDTVRPDAVRPDPTVPSTLQITAPQPAPSQRETPPLDPSDIEHLFFPVSEAGTTAVTQGRSVRFRLWSPPDSMATVADPVTDLSTRSPVCCPSPIPARPGWACGSPASSAASHPRHHRQRVHHPPRRGTPQPGRSGHAPNTA